METTIEAGPAPAASLAPARDDGPLRLGFDFRGSAAEYFRIWIVNLALTVVTLGIYSAWAKVRRLRYLHGHTWLDGSAFGYHGEPLKILKGRAIAALFMVAYVAAGRLHPVAGAVAGLLLGLAMPWLVVKSLKFRLRMTSWRGLRFDFDEDFGAAYRIYLGWGTLAVVSLGLLMPVFLRRLHRFTVQQSAYGTTYFECDPPLRPIYVALLKAIVFGLVVGLSLALAMGAAIGWLSVASPGETSLAMLQLLPLAVMLVVYVGAYAIFNAGLLNAVYGHTTLGPHRLQSELRGGRLAWIYGSNVVAIVASLGLLVPWATVRVLRYRLATLAVMASGSLEEFVAAQGATSPEATGEEIADFFDVDFGL